MKIDLLGKRVQIVHANTKNPLRKDDVGRIGTVKEVRCSFIKVLLDGDTKVKNYNYGTFKEYEDKKESE